MKKNKFSPRQCRLNNCNYNMLQPRDFSQECIGCEFNRYKKNSDYVKKVHQKWFGKGD